MKLPRPATLRARLTVVAALTVAATIALASVLVYVFMRADLRHNVDRGLRDRAAQYQQRPFELDQFERGFFDHLPSSPFGSGRDYVQLVNSAGQTARPPGEAVPVPVDEQTRNVAAGRRPSYITDVSVGGIHARVLAVPLADGVALQIVRSLRDVDNQLGRLRWILLLVSLGGVAVATAGGALVSRATLSPVRRLTHAAERVAETRDASERVQAGGDDELARLAGAFNTMLAALDDAIETQKRFVADASHELRTPLTSLSTNVDVLARTEKLSVEDRTRILADLKRELQEMRGLVGGLVELARGRDGHRELQAVRIDELVDSAVERARARFPEIAFETDLEPSTAAAYPDRLSRAVWNLLENAGKWSPAGSAVEVRLHGGELSVRDHGPGIAEEDRPFVFDRFYRATTARGMPGSGLGLAIVDDVAREHGASVEVEDADGGGTRITLRLPLYGDAQST